MKQDIENYLVEIIQQKVIAYCSISSLDIRKSALFFAIKGERHDGHSFLEEVASKGATHAVVRMDYNGPDFGLKLLRVDNVIQTLQEVARQIKAIRNNRVIAITGSVGKTTTKEFLFQLLKKNRVAVAATEGNQNTQITVPLTICNAPESIDYLIIEMGMTQTGQIHNLVNIVKPCFSILTTIAYSHAQNFNSLEELSAAKGEIFSHDATQLGIHPLEISLPDRVLKQSKCDKITFSINKPEANYYLNYTQKNSYAEIYWNQEKVWEGSLPFYGKHNAHNLLTALCAAHLLGCTWSGLCDSIQSLKLPKWRLEEYLHKDVLFINDAYNNSTPHAIMAAIDSLPQTQSFGRKVLVFSEMRELGFISQASHIEVAKYAIDKVDYLVTFGKECRHMFPIWEASNRHTHFEDSEEMYSFLKNNFLQQHDVVLFKGSRIYDFPKIIERLIRENP